MDLAGAGPPRKEKKKKVKALDELKCYHILPEDYINGDSLRLRKEEWNEEAFHSESMPLVHALFRFAHGEYTLFRRM